MIINHTQTKCQVKSRVVRKLTVNTNGWPDRQMDGQTRPNLLLSLAMQSVRRNQTDTHHIQSQSHWPCHTGRWCWCPGRRMETWLHCWYQSPASRRCWVSTRNRPISLDRHKMRDSNAAFDSYNDGMSDLLVHSCSHECELQSEGSCRDLMTLGKLFTPMCLSSSSISW